MPAEVHFFLLYAFPALRENIQEIPVLLTLHIPEIECGLMFREGLEQKRA